MIIGAVVLLCIPLGLVFKPIKNIEFNRSNECCEGADESGDLGNRANGCCGCNFVFVTKIGKGSIELLSDMKFILFVLSNLLTAIGFAVPYAYTVASSKKIIIISRAHCSKKD